MINTRPKIFVAMHMGFEPDHSAEKVAILKEIFESQFELIFDKTVTKKRTFLPGELSEILDIVRFSIIDLSFERPSCYYEIGFIDALGGEKFLIAKSQTIIHQHDQNDIVHFYSDIGEYRSILEACRQMFIKI